MICTLLTYRPGAGRAGCLVADSVGLSTFTATQRATRTLVRYGHPGSPVESPYAI